MSALAFDPWAALKCKAGDTPPANVANSANPAPAALHRLAELAGLAGRASPSLKTTIEPRTSPPAVATSPSDADDDPPPLTTTLLPVIPLAEQVEAMAQAMMSNPVYRITNPEKAMEYFRANALTRLYATSDPLARGLLLGWERHRGAMAVHSRPTGR